MVVTELSKSPLVGLRVEIVVHENGTENPIQLPLGKIIRTMGGEKGISYCLVHLDHPVKSVSGGTGDDLILHNIRILVGISNVLVLEEDNPLLGRVLSETSDSKSMNTGRVLARLYRARQRSNDMGIGPNLESARSLLDLFENYSAKKLFLKEMAERVTKDIGLARTSIQGTLVEPVVRTLSRLELRQTPDDPQSRERLIERATSDVRDRLTVKAITKLSTEGIIFEAGYDVAIVGYRLLAQIWH